MLQVSEHTDEASDALVWGVEAGEEGKAMTVLIDKRITGFEIKDKIEKLDENFKREEVLQGKTYKIRPGTSDHALYITINDIILNPGTEHESRRPFEVFVNSKNMEFFPWVVALTRIISAVFRKGGDCTFLVGELRSVFDPKGGYFKKGGRFMPSVVAEIGDVLEQHLQSIGLIKPTELDAGQKKLIKEKKAQYEASVKAAEEVTGNGYPSEAKVCARCGVKAVIRLDNCDTCLACSDSKCG